VAQFATQIARLLHLLVLVPLGLDKYDVEALVAFLETL